MYITQEIVKRIRTIAKTQNIKTGVMLSECGLGVNTLSEFGKGKQISCISLATLADYLNCSVDYLLGRTKNPQSHTDNGKMAGLSDEEQRLIAGYRELNDEGQKQAVIYVTEMLLQNVRYTQKSNSNNAKEA